MENIFFGATKEQAISKAEKAMNLNRKFLLINILEEPENKTIYSILNKKNVKIEASINEEKRKLIKRLDNNKKKRKKQLTVEELNNNKDVIENFLKGLTECSLNIEDINYSIKEEEKDFHINFETSNNALLIGNKGSTINALQTYIQQLLILKCRPSANVFLDAGNYKEKRYNYLIKTAEEAAFKIRQSGEEIALEPMSSFERKIIHDTLMNYPDLDTKSEGKEPNRYVVIFPAKI